MKKVYNVIRHSVYEFDSTITVKTFATKELAKECFLSLVEDAEASAENELDEDETVIDKNIDNLSFDVYKDGRASEWNINVYVEESEVCERYQMNYLDQLIIRENDKTKFYLFNADGDIVSNKADSVKDAVRRINRILAKQNGLYDAAGELYYPF